MIGIGASQTVAARGLTAWVLSQEPAGGTSNNRLALSRPSRIRIASIDPKPGIAFPALLAFRSLSWGRVPGLFDECGDIGVQRLQRGLVRIHHVAGRIEVHLDVVLQGGLNRQLMQ